MPSPIGFDALCSESPVYIAGLERLPPPHWRAICGGVRTKHRASDWLAALTARPTSYLALIGSWLVGLELSIFASEDHEDSLAVS